MGPCSFILLYVAAAVTLAPAFFLTVAAGAMFGVWRGSLIVFIGASLGASAVSSWRADVAVAADGPADAGPASCRRA